jgi:hypothetical protein
MEHDQPRSSPCSHQRHSIRGDADFEASEEGLGKRNEIDDEASIRSKVIALLDGLPLVEKCKILNEVFASFAVGEKIKPNNQQLTSVLDMTNSIQLLELCELESPESW